MPEKEAQEGITAQETMDHLVTVMNEWNVLAALALVIEREEGREKVSIPGVVQLFRDFQEVSTPDGIPDIQGLTLFLRALSDVQSAGTKYPGIVNGAYEEIKRL